MVIILRRCVGHVDQLRSSSHFLGSVTGILERGSVTHGDFMHVQWLGLYIENQTKPGTGEQLSRVTEGQTGGLVRKTYLSADHSKDESTNPNGRTIYNEDIRRNY